MFKFLTAVEGTDQPTQIIDQEKLNAIERIFDFDFGLPEQLQVFVNKCIEVVAVFIVLLIFMNNYNIQCALTKFFLKFLLYFLHSLIIRISSF